MIYWTTYLIIKKKYIGYKATLNPKIRHTKSTKLMSMI